MLLSELQTDESQVIETNYSNTPYGPSSQSCCKVVVGNSCGSGSLVGIRDGKSLVLTNAHVAGTRPGSVAKVTFPGVGNKVVTARLIMAGYSDKVMMDWAILECEELINLPHVKLAIKPPEGEHYTGGYPRCKGPVYQKLQTRQITHGGTVWRWQPDSIGGQSGSGVHSFADKLQYGLLTWSWGGDGAGQTTRSIWLQYATKAAIAAPREDGLIELSEVNPLVENGIFFESEITELPIWAHLDGGDNPPPPPPSGNCDELIKQLQVLTAEMLKSATKLDDYLKSYKPGSGAKPTEPQPPANDGASGTFGL
jgi:hypothetical protein